MSRAAGARNHNLDFLRGLAAVAVLYGHAGQLVHPSSNSVARFAAGHGWTGIYLFFALSGYLITRKWVAALEGGAPAPSISGYARRRAARIYPAYWLALAAAAALAGINVSVVAVAAHIPMLQSLVPGQALSILPVAWTLSIEELFYIAVPIAFVGLRRRGLRRWDLGRLVMFVWGAGILVNAGLSWAAAELNPSGDDFGWTTVLTHGLPSLLAFFCPGILIAVYEQGPRPPAWYHRLTEHPGQVLAGAAFLWLVTAEAGGLPSVALSLIAVAGYSTAAGLAVVAMLHGGPQLTRCVRPFSGLGLVSYGIYLWHYTIARYLAGRGVVIGDGQPWDQLLAAALLLALTLPIAAGSWLLVEKPLMRRAAAADVTAEPESGRLPEAAAPSDVDFSVSRARESVAPPPGGRGSPASVAPRGGSRPR